MYCCILPVSALSMQIRVADESRGEVSIYQRSATASTLSFEKSRGKKKRVAKPGPVVGTKRYASSDVRCRDDGK